MKQALSIRMLSACAVLLLFAAPADAQQCGTALANAERQYNNGDFDTVIQRLSNCLDQNAFTIDQRREAYRLIGLSYIGKDREAEARQAVRSLLEVAPNYQPNPEVDPPPFSRMVNEERRSASRSSGVTTSAAGPARLHVSFHAEGAMLSVENASGSDNGYGGRLGITYLVTPSIGIDAFGRVDQLNPGSYTLTEFGLGARYQFNLDGAFTPYVGLGSSYRSAEITSQGLTIKMTGMGGTVYGGIQYALNPTIALDLNLGSTFGDLDHDWVSPFSTTSAQVGLGVVWSPSW